MASSFVWLADVLLLKPVRGRAALVGGACFVCVFLCFRHPVIGDALVQSWPFGLAQTGNRNPPS